MTTKPIVNVIVNSDDAKHIKKAVPQIRQELEDKGCTFPIEANVLLGALLDKCEQAAKMKCN